MEYKVIELREEKEAWKDGLRELFREIFQKELSEKDWRHFFLQAPYEPGVLVLGVDQQRVVATANLIPQKLRLDQEVYDYYLFTTSMVHKDYRLGGAYLETIKIIKDVMRKKNKRFILAFPNADGCLLLTGLCSFRSLGTLSLVQLDDSLAASFAALSMNHSIVFDHDFISWRFAHREYFYSVVDDKVLIGKEFDRGVDLVEIMPYEYFDRVAHQLNIKECATFKRCHVLKSRIEDQPGATFKDQVRPVFFTDDKGLVLSSMNVSLLMSDVY